MNKDNQILTQRREKADALAALGVNLYGNSFKPANSVQELLPKADALQPEQAEPGHSRYSLAGRVL
jgi:lysyl-tRNA synthetase class 2